MGQKQKHIICKNFFNYVLEFCPAARFSLSMSPSTHTRSIPAYTTEEFAAGGAEASPEAALPETG
jgi:hypothetical protein